MLDTLSILFSGLTSGEETLKALNRFLRRRKGDSRAFLEEMKENIGLCWMVVELGTDPKQIVPELRTVEYDRLCKEGFDFNRLTRKNRRIIRGGEALLKSDLKSFAGKDTASLVENLYDRIKALKRLYRVDLENPRIDWRRRVFNVLKRALLLMKHLKGELP